MSRLSMLLDTLLTQRTPGMLCKHIPRRRQGTYPLDLEIGAGSSSSARKVEEISLITWGGRPSLAARRVPMPMGIVGHAQHRDQGDHRPLGPTCAPHTSK